MRPVEELAMFFREQLAINQDTLHSYSSKFLKDFPDSDRYVDMFKERVDVIKVICEVLISYKKFEQDGLSKDIDITVLESLKSYCIQEKERLNKKVYENIKIRNRFYDAYQDSETAGLWQDAELYLLRLIALNSDTSIKE